MVVGSEEMENADNELSIHIGCECVNVDFILENLIKYNNNPSYSTKEENQFEKEGLTPLILKAFEHSHINVKHKHREKELEILFFESKQELYNSINKP